MANTIKPLEEMSHQEREEANLLQLRTAIEQAKSGVLKRGKATPPKAKPAAEPDQSSQESVRE